LEIKCQLDATDEFLLQTLVLAQHVSGTIMPIIRSSRVLYKWLLPVVFGAVKMPKTQFRHLDIPSKIQCNTIEIIKEKRLKYFTWYLIYVLILKFGPLAAEVSPRNLSFDLSSVHVESVVEKCQ
jgi:hypothetical protein